MKQEETIQHDIHEEYKKQLIGFEYQERAVLGLLLQIETQPAPP